MLVADLLWPGHFGHAVRQFAILDRRGRVNDVVDPSTHVSFNAYAG